MAIFCNVLHAAASDDDVLVLSQISSSGKCCVLPLVHLKDGSSEGSLAEWRDATYYLRKGKQSLKIAPLSTNSELAWNIISGGSGTLPSSAITWNCLQIFPYLPDSMRRVLEMKEKEVLFFKLEIKMTSGDAYKSSPGVVMVRMLDGKITCKKRMSYEALVVSTLDEKPKLVLKISKA